MAVPDEHGKTCIHCGTTIEKLDTVHRFPDGEVVHIRLVTRLGAAIAGLQGAKTFVGSLWAGKKINQFPEGVGIIGAPSYKILN